MRGVFDNYTWFLEEFPELGNVCGEDSSPRFTYTDYATFRTNVDEHCCDWRKKNGNMTTDIAEVRFTKMFSRMTEGADIPQDLLEWMIDNCHVFTFSHQPKEFLQIARQIVHCMDVLGRAQRSCTHTPEDDCLISTRQFEDHLHDDKQKEECRGRPNTHESPSLAPPVVPIIIIEHASRRDDWNLWPRRFSKRRRRSRSRSNARLVQSVSPTHRPLPARATWFRLVKPYDSSAAAAWWSW
jgi:hypothetical protein